MVRAIFRRAFFADSMRRRCIFSSSKVLLLFVARASCREARFAAIASW